jgi:polysaccharide biosynthesis transport protein
MAENKLIISLPNLIEETAEGTFTAARALPGTQNRAHETSGLPILRYLWIWRRNWWKMLAFILASVVATAIISSRIQPMYDSTATVDVDRQMPAGIIGQDAVRPGGNDADQFLATQVKLIQSDSVLRPVAARYKLVDAEQHNAGAAEEQAPREDAPVMLRNLKVTRPPNTYLLSITYRAKDPQLAADVANGISRSYIEHTYNIRYRSSSSLSAFMEKQLEELKAKMEASSGALAQFERELNIINPEEKTSILSARLMQLNTEYTNAQTDRVRKETAYRSVKSGSLEAAQVSTQGESLKKLSERLHEAQQKFADVQTHFGVNHPEYKKAATQVSELRRLLEEARANIAQRVEVEYTEATNREAMLQKTVAQTKMEFDRLNAHSFEYQARKREAEADKKLYEELVRKIKEASINAGFQNSAIRIADAARPAHTPAFPNKKLYLSLAFLFSTLVSLATVVVGDALNHVIRDPELVARSLNTEVIGTVPRTKELRGRAMTQAKPEPAGSFWLVPPANASLNGYDAAIRTLRNSILLADFDQRLRSLMITSSSPSEGKSTIAANLAIAHAQQGRPTLLIDGDLRGPSVHKQFDLSPEFGLTNVLQAQAGWRDVVVNYGGAPALHLLPAGPPSHRAADLLGDALLGILEEARNYYDLVIVDSPPVLGFPEPLHMAKTVDGVIVVAHARQTDRRALGSTLNALARLRVKILGIVVNQVSADNSNGYYHYYNGRKYRKYYQTGA